MSGALKLQLRGVETIGRVWFNAEEKGEAATHFLSAGGQCSTTQGAVVKRL
jgi:hypothetical protein